MFEESGLNYVKVKPVISAEFQRLVVLDHMAIRLNGLIDLPNWRDSLKYF